MDASICPTFRNAQGDESDTDILIHYVHNTDKYHANMDILFTYILH